MLIQALLLPIVPRAEKPPPPTTGALLAPSDGERAERAAAEGSIQSRGSMLDRR